METKLTFDRLVFCYKSLQKYRTDMGIYHIGKHLGYLEAGLVTYGYLETEMINNIIEVKREIKLSSKWWKKSKKETYEEAIIRMTLKMFNENNIKYEE